MFMKLVYYIFTRTISIRVYIYIWKKYTYYVYKKQNLTKELKIKNNLHFVPIHDGSGCVAENTRKIRSREVQFQTSRI